jgi:flagellin-specific chaperone FliS
MSLYYAMKSIQKIYERTLDLMSEINTGKDVSASIEEIEDLSQDLDLALNEIGSSLRNMIGLLLRTKGKE